MSSIETELKFLFTKKDFHRLYNYLKSNCPAPCIKKQTNYYFASASNPLKEHPINIRIRFSDSQSEMTCKVPIREKTTDTVQHSYEYNKAISRPHAKDLIRNGMPAKTIEEIFPEMLKEQHDLIPLDLICHGHLRTARISFQYAENLPPILLDVNRYLNTFDYELEWELDNPDEAGQMLNKIFGRLDISPSGQMRPKRYRFFIAKYEA